MIRSSETQVLVTSFDVFLNLSQLYGAITISFSKSKWKLGKYCEAYEKKGWYYRVVN